MNEDPRSTIATSPMSTMQIVIVALCVLLNALDGFDVLSISFASPGIAAEWGVDRASLGIVLSMELVGMAGGSVALGMVADRIGRRPTVLLCLIVMTCGMAAAMLADDVLTLSACRLATGVGIGGMLAVTAALVAEVANDRSRSLCVALMAAGYPAGAVIGGTVASSLLVDHSWRSVFAFGAATTALCIPLAWLLLPETVAWMIQARPAGALAKTNRSLRTFGHPVVDHLPPPAGRSEKRRLARLFDRSLARTTILLTLGYFAHIMTFYFILKWIPKIVADMGFAPALAGGVLVWANLGGVAGSVTLSLLTRKAPTRPLVVGSMLLSIVAVALFGRSSPDLAQLSILAAAAGFFTNGAVVGLYALFAAGFPTDVRAAGTGLAIGIGRGGAALSPILAGFMFTSGLDLPMVAMMMAGGSLVGACCLMGLRARAVVPTSRDDEVTPRRSSGQDVGAL